MFSRTSMPKSEERLARTPAQQETAACEGPALSRRQNTVLQLQRQRGNQYVLRMLAGGAPDRQTVQRDDADEEQPAQGDSSASNSMVGDAAGWLGDTLGLNGMGNKIKQGIGKTQDTVNQGIDWTLGKVRSGTKAVEDWIEQ